MSIQSLRYLIKEIILNENDVTSMLSGQERSIWGAIKNAFAGNDEESDEDDLYKIDDEIDQIEDTPEQITQQVFSDQQEYDPDTLDDIAKEIASAYPKMSSYANEIVNVSKNIDIDPKWLANVINFESGGNPKAINKISNATGLIQFMPKTASSLGTSTSSLYGMSGKDQMKYVEDYFMPYRGRLNSQEDVYMAVFYPKAIGKPDYQFPSAVVKSNPGIRTPRDYAQKANRNAKLR